MSIRKNIPSLRINHKPRGLARHGQIRIKRRRLAEMNAHNALDHALDRLLPFRRVLAVDTRTKREGQTTATVMMMVVLIWAVGV
jgi:hypothetical protein